MIKVGKAMTLAFKYHEGQKYGVRDYFEYHLCGVVHILKSFEWDSDLEITVAWLHDILEDTTCTEEELAEHFPIEVVASVKALTKLEGESRFEYLVRLRHYPVATRVKIADSTFNMHSCLKDGDLPRAEKYYNNINFLYNHL